MGIKIWSIFVDSEYCESNQSSPSAFPMRIASCDGQQPECNSAIMSLRELFFAKRFPPALAW